MKLTGTTSLVSVEGQNNSTFQFSLSQNYPNPFNPITTISWQLAQGTNVIIKVFDMLGQDVATLINGYKDAGNYRTEFNAANLPSGIYFYQLRAGDFIDTKKMILLR